MTESMSDLGGLFKLYKANTNLHFKSQPVILRFALLKGVWMKNSRRSVCPVACALDVIGDKWTLLVVRDIFLGRRYFKDFLSSPEGIATNILADRLKRLADAGLVRAQPDQGTIGRYFYELTDKGVALMPVLESLRHWGLENIKGTSARLQSRS